MELKAQITIDDAVNLLNDALSKDETAIITLFKTMFKCNMELANHNSIECYENYAENAYISAFGMIRSMFINPEYKKGSICIKSHGYEVTGFSKIQYEKANVIKESVTIDEVIELLNDALKADNNTITRLFLYRVECNERLANHETIQVGLSDSSYKIGLLGLLNGMFGIDENGYGAIMMIIEEGKITKFKKVKEGI